jgi:hypothetical protein
VLGVGEAAQLLCAGDTTIGRDSEPLAYGDAITAGPLRCESAQSGITCRDVESGQGFSISREAYQLFRTVLCYLVEREAGGTVRAGQEYRCVALAFSSPSPALCGSHHFTQCSCSRVDGTGVLRPTQTAGWEGERRTISRHLAKSIAERCRLIKADGDSIQSGSVICRRGA